MGSLVPKPEPFSVTGTVSGNEAGFIPQDGLLFRHADTQGWAQTEVLDWAHAHVWYSGVCSMCCCDNSQQ